MLRRITKSIFCKKEVCGNSDLVVDGAITNGLEPVLHTSPEELVRIMVKEEERETISVESEL